MSASVLVQRLRPLSHINPGAIGWHAGLGGSVPVGMGQFETGKVQAIWFPVFFLYCSGLVRNLISITRRSSSFAALTGTFAATLLRPLSTAFMHQMELREMENKLWQCPLKVERGTYNEMPESWLGATVNYYVGASTYEEALTKVVQVLQSVGMVFVDLVDGKVMQLDPESWWEGYVMANYPECSDYFPSQDQVFNVVSEGLVFHGPFAGWGHD